MTKKQTNDTIYDAEFTESSTGELETAEVDNSEDVKDTESSLVIADPLKPLSPTQAEGNGFSGNIKSLLITVAVIAVLLLAALYLRGLQLAAV